MNPKIKKIGILKKMMGSFTGTTSDRSVDPYPRQIKVVLD